VIDQYQMSSTSAEGSESGLKRIGFSEAMTDQDGLGRLFNLIGYIFARHDPSDPVRFLCVVCLVLF